MLKCRIIPIIRFSLQIRLCRYARLICGEPVASLISSLFEMLLFPPSMGNTSVHYQRNTSHSVTAYKFTWCNGLQTVCVEFAIPFATFSMYRNRFHILEMTISEILNASTLRNWIFATLEFCTRRNE